MRPILQVEDDPNDVFFLQHAMKKAGVANPVQVATDGQQAIDYLQGVGKFADRQKFPLPCLILLDLKLPHVMGLDVLKWIRQQSGIAVAVVMLTASSEESDIATAYRLGANGFLVKPSEVDKLVEMAKAINAFWLTYNSLPWETCREPAVAPVRSAAIAPAARNLPAARRAQRDEPHSMMSRQTYQKNQSLTL
jgi:two-component system response regulator